MAKKAAKKAAPKKEQKYRGGRTPMPEGERKELVQLFIPGKHIEAMGGMDELRRKLIEFVEKTATKK